MIDRIIEIDLHWFSHIQEHWTNGFLDTVMPFIRDKYNWIALYVLFIALAIILFKKKAVWVIAVALLTVVLADQFSAGLIKPMAMRIRPCNEPSLAQLFRHLVDCGSGYSFISAHACNHFALAIYFIWFFNQWKASFVWAIVFLLWASSIAFAQVYVGVHYPLDVIIGAGAGLSIGWLMVQFIRWVMHKTS